MPPIFLVLGLLNGSNSFISGHPKKRQEIKSTEAEQEPEYLGITSDRFMSQFIKFLGAFHGFHLSIHSNP